MLSDLLINLGIFKPAPVRCPCGRPVANAKEHPAAAAASKCVVCYQISLYVDRLGKAVTS